MIISRTPHRISLFGGGTDFPEYYMKYGGKVLGTAIDKYCYLNVRRLPPFFEYKHRIVYSKTENVNRLDEIQHPSVREVLRYLKIDYGVSIHHDGDIPARSGMGSSSAFTVGLLNSLYALEGKYISDEDLAAKAIHVEQELIRENVGSQDQTFAAYGCFNLIEFCRNGKINVTPVIISPARMAQFECSLMLFFTGIARNSSEIAEEQVKRTSANTDILHGLKKLADDAVGILADERADLRGIGELMNQAWAAKKKLSSRISNDFINQAYQAGVNAGAVGGKLLGAGGGGFLLFFVPEEKRTAIRNALKNLLEVPFKFEFQGSKIIVYQPNS